VDIVNDEAKSAALMQVTYGLYLIGSRAGDELNVMTANWLTQTSFDPPYVVVAIQEDAHTRTLIDAGKVFNIQNIPSGAKDLLLKFVKPAERAGSKLEGEEYSEAPTTGTPVLAAALSYVECVVEQAIPTGSHILYIGRVVGAGVQHEGTPITMAETGMHYAG
jgi:flavin reductase (DIM6/NTAB) family NADH-FMN oxidoreductase RutF